MADRDKCPSCGAAAIQTTNSRPSGEADILRYRSKACRGCGHKFKTIEVLAGENNLDLRANNLASVKSFLRGVDALARREFGDENGYLTTRMISVSKDTE